jgi:glycosyltransferase involved in cell wall biosynthesis
VPARDPEPMARAIVALASNPSRAERIGRAARAEVEQRFSLRGMVGRYQGLYDRLLGRSTLH